MSVRSGPLYRGLRRLGFAAAMLVLVAQAVAAGAQQRIVLTTGAEQPWSTPDGRGFLNLLVEEAMARLGVVGEVQMFTSSERALLNAQRGIDDGVAMRIAGLEAQYPNLVRVDEPVAFNDFVALGPAARPPKPGWDQLQGYAVGYVNGWKIFEARVGEGPAVTKLRDADQLFTLLASGRLEVGLYERWQGLHKARQHRMAVAVAEPPLARVPMYLYLHVRHAALVPRLAQVLGAMKRDGSYDRIWKTAIETSARNVR